MPLNQTQINNRNAIYQYGIENGYSSEHVQIAINMAYIESSVGQFLVNKDKNSTASGLFQYNNPTWANRHNGLGEKNNHSNQIQAFYSDLSRYVSWYTNPETNSSIPSDMSLTEYIATKHHDGVNYTDFENAPGRKNITKILMVANLKNLMQAWARIPEDSLYIQIFI